MLKIIGKIFFLYLVYVFIYSAAIGKADQIPLPYEKAQEAFFAPLHRVVPHSIQRDILCDLFYLQERAKPAKLAVKGILRSGYAVLKESKQLCRSLKQRAANHKDTANLFAWQEEFQAFKAHNLERLQQLRQQYPSSNASALQVLSSVFEHWPDSFYVRHPTRNTISLIRSISLQKEEHNAEKIVTIISNNLLKNTHKSLSRLTDFAEALYGERLAPKLHSEWLEIQQQMPLLLVQE